MTAIGSNEAAQLAGFGPDVRPEWVNMSTSHRNLLLEGPTPATESALRRLGRHFCEPVVSMDSSAPLDLPTGKVGTLVVRGVGDLRGDQQLRLLQWLDSADPATRVLSTTDGPLFPRVTAGVFNASLYYRINTLMLQLSADVR